MVVGKLDGFLISSHDGSDGFDDLFVGSLLFGVFVESDLVDGVEEFFEVFLDRLRFGSLGKDLQQSWVGDEVESWELLSFLFQILFQ